MNIRHFGINSNSFLSQQKFFFWLICPEPQIHPKAMSLHDSGFSPLPLVFPLLLSFLPSLGVSSSSSFSSLPCISFSPLFKFDSSTSPQPHSDLTFCKEYRQATCCQSSHTQIIVRMLQPYFEQVNIDNKRIEKIKQYREKREKKRKKRLNSQIEMDKTDRLTHENQIQHDQIHQIHDDEDQSDSESTSDFHYPVGYFSDSCRQFSSSILCSPCSPFVGTGVQPSICLSTCNDWFHACSPFLFEMNQEMGRIQPCAESSLICSPLEEIVASGSEMCRMNGFAVEEIEPRFYKEKEKKRERGSGMSTASRKDESVDEEVKDELLNFLRESSSSLHQPDSPISLSCFDASSSRTFSAPPRRADDFNSGTSSSKKKGWNRSESSGIDRVERELNRMYRQVSRLYQSLDWKGQILFSLLIVVSLMSIQNLIFWMFSTFRRILSRRLGRDSMESRLSPEQVRALRAARLQYASSPHRAAAGPGAGAGTTASGSASETDSPKWRRQLQLN